MTTIHILTILLAASPILFTIYCFYPKPKAYTVGNVNPLSPITYKGTHKHLKPLINNINNETETLVGPLMRSINKDTGILVESRPSSPAPLERNGE